MKFSIIKETAVVIKNCMTYYVPEIRSAPPVQEPGIDNLSAEIVAAIENRPAMVSLAVCFISLILGAVITCTVNAGAMRRQCRFNLRHEVLREDRKKVHT